MPSGVALPSQPWIAVAGAIVHPVLIVSQPAGVGCGRQSLRVQAAVRLSRSNAARLSTTVDASGDQNGVVQPCAWSGF